MSIHGPRTTDNGVASQEDPRTTDHGPRSGGASACMSAVSPLSAAIQEAQKWRACAGGPGPAPEVSAAAAAPRVRLVVDSVHVSEPALAALFTKI
jgi:hypothetical protein